MSGENKKINFIFLMEQAKNAGWPAKPIKHSINNSNQSSTNKTKSIQLFELNWLVCVDWWKLIVGLLSLSSSNKTIQSTISFKLKKFNLMKVDWFCFIEEESSPGLTALILFHQISFQSIWFHQMARSPTAFIKNQRFLKPAWWVIDFRPAPIHSTNLNSPLPVLLNKSC